MNQLTKNDWEAILGPEKYTEEKKEILSNVTTAPPSWMRMSPADLFFTQNGNVSSFKKNKFTHRHTDPHLCSLRF